MTHFLCNVPGSSECSTFLEHGEESELTPSALINEELSLSFGKFLLHLPVDVSSLVSQILVRDSRNRDSMSEEE